MKIKSTEEQKKARKKEINKKWREKNKERKRKKDKEWTEKNKERKMEKDKKWRKENKERIKDYYIKRKKKMPWLSHYRAAKGRCIYKKNNKYKNYGAKGIKMLLTVEEVKILWLRDRAFEMNKPSIDRINSKDDYKFSNCRFIELGLNSRLANYKNKGRECSLKGKTWDSVKAAAEENGISRATLFRYLKNKLNGWSYT